MAFSISNTGNSITLTGSSGDDTVSISVSTSGYFRHDIPVAGNLVSEIDTNSALPGEQALLASAVTSISLNAGSGNDTVLADDWVAVGLRIDTGLGNDVVRGSAANDEINGGGGDDIIQGQAGNDKIHGDSGNDVIEGNAGDDILYGDGSYASASTGNDILRGGDGNDTLYGDDFFYGGTGDDQFYGGAGIDVIHDSFSGTLLVADASFQSNLVISENPELENIFITGSAANDIIDASAYTRGKIVAYGKAGDDSIRGGLKDDELYGDGSSNGFSTGNDTIFGGDGNDAIYGDDRYNGGNGNDILNGGLGNDLIDGYGGDDFAYGNDGNDKIYGDSGNDVIEGNAGDDILYGDGSYASASTGNDILRGGDGNDTLYGDDFFYGGTGDDQFYGGAGIDVIHDSFSGTLLVADASFQSNLVISENPELENIFITGSAANDIIDASAYTRGKIVAYGKAGDDSIRGGLKDDELYGDGSSNGFSTGNDTIFGGDGNDAIYGDDRYNGGNGNDILNGGLGNDLIDGYGGDDFAYGNDGNDKIYGESGNDVIEGNAGDDILYGDGSYDSASTGNDVLRGGDGNDTLYGDDFYYGGTGNDFLEGGDGIDYLRGFGGNDSFLVTNAMFTDVLADAGYDKLFFTGTEIQLDLVANNKVSGIEEIDISGSGDNSLKINQARVLSLSDSTDTLIVSGNVGDRVDKGAGWALSGTETINGALFKNYTQGAATLKLQQTTDSKLQLAPKQNVGTITDSLDSANPTGFSGPFGVVGVQSYQGLGPTGNQFNSNFLKSSTSATLTLTDLPTHDEIDIGFLLAIIDSWNGGTSDYFNVLVDGVSVFRESFHYNDLAGQSYQAPQGGLLSFGSQLGFSSWSDAAYDMNVEPKLKGIQHSASSLTIQWLANGSGWQGGSDESWAIDNLKITLYQYALAIPDNLTAGELVGTLRSQDIDLSSTFTYSLTSGTGDADNVYFTISGNELRTAQPLIPNKTSYSIRLRATDQNGVPFDQVLTISVIPSNKAPTDIALSASTIAENEPANATIGSFSTTDPNDADTFSYTLVTGTGDADNAAFSIDGNSIKANNSFDFESNSNYSIRIRSTDQDGLFIEKTFTISVTNVNESPTDISLTPNIIAENAGANAIVGALNTTDPDASNSFAYTLVPGSGDSDNAAFNIDGSNLRANASFDFETKSSYSVRVRSTDQGGLFTEKVLTISVTDLDENIYITGLATADTFLATYTGNGSDAAWTLTRNGTTLLTNRFIPNGGALVIDGLAGSDTLQVNGRTVDDSLRLAANTITTNNAPIEFSNTEIVKLVPGAGNDSLIVAQAAPAGVAVSFDGGAGTDRIEALLGNNTWNITGAGIGTLNSALSYLAIETLRGGTGEDQFLLTNAGKVTGQLHGGTGNDTLNLAAKTTAHTINLQSNTATSTGGISGFENFIGGNLATVTDVLIGPNSATTWTIDGVNAGNLSSSTTGTVYFSGFDSLTGGTAVDSFVVANGGSVSKTITGGTATGAIDTLDLSAKSTALDFRLDATTSSIPGSVGAYTGFESVTGNALADTKVTRVNNTTTAWAVNSTGQIVVSAVNYINVTNIVGGPGVDTLSGPALATAHTASWNVNSAGGGSLAIPGANIAFSGMNNLTGGTGADSFEILPAGSLSGAINGGTGTGLNSLSYAQWTSSVSVNLAVTTAANAIGIAGVTSNIQLVIGGSGNDTLQGQASKSTILIGLGGNDNLTGGSQRDLLFGGTGADILIGSGGDDLMISGSTSHDTNRQALFSIYSEWISTRTFAVRTANIWGNGSGTNANGQFRLNSDAGDSITDTVFADGDIDTLTGGLNQDWFFASVNDTADFTGTGATPDRLNR